jgi:endonuclease G
VNGGTAVLAEALPMAVNVSLGMNTGAHDGSSTLESAFDQISGNRRDPGFVVVKSAGNERSFDGHVRLRAGEGATGTVTWSTTAEVRTKDYIEVWWSNLDELEFVLVDPRLHRSPVVSTASPRAEAILGNAVCTMELTALHPDNGASRLVIRLLHQPPAPMDGRWQLDITGKRILSRDAWVDAWVERDESRAVRFDNSDNTMTLSIPGTARTVITVGACNASPAQVRLTDSSSWGLTRDGRPKPDLCAPGEAVRAACAGTTDGAIAKTGTSMAAPMVTGTLALVLSRRQIRAGQTSGMRVSSRPD